jgi:hypothetical protein
LMTQNQKFSVKPPSRLEAIAHHADEKEGDCDHQRESCSDSGTAATPADGVFGSDSGTKPPVPIPADGELGKMAAAVPPMTGAQLTQRRVACSRVCATCRAGRFQDFRFCDLVHTPRCRNALIISYVERVPWPAFCTAAYAPTTTWDARRLRSWTSNWFSCSCLSVP